MPAIVITGVLIAIIVSFTNVEKTSSLVAIVCAMFVGIMFQMSVSQLFDATWNRTCAMHKQSRTRAWRGL